MSIKIGIKVLLLGVMVGLASHASAEVQINVIPQKVTVIRDSGLTSTEIQKVLNLLRSFGYTPRDIVVINDRLIRKKIEFTPADGSVLTRELKVGSQGEDVRALQKFLNRNGASVASSGSGSSGKESAYFGERTQKALATFQVAVGLPGTGALDEKTRTLIIGH